MPTLTKEAIRPITFGLVSADKLSEPARAGWGDEFERFTNALVSIIEEGGKRASAIRSDPDLKGAARMSSKLLSEAAQASHKRLSGVSRPFLQKLEDAQEAARGECQDSCRLEVVHCVVAISAATGAGLSTTCSTGDQFLVVPDQRSGRRSRAAT